MEGTHDARHPGSTPRRGNGRKRRRRGHRDVRQRSAERGTGDDRRRQSHRGSEGTLSSGSRGP
ncbi:MAG: hypothetical protein OXF84_08595 [Bacteroidetes bacterium]|nr:hypothetical protein [Bacteroidota bacterium]